MGTVTIEPTHKVTTTVYNLIEDLADNVVEESTCYCKSYEEAKRFFYSAYELGFQDIWKKWANTAIF